MREELESPMINRDELRSLLQKQESNFVNERALLTQDVKDDKLLYVDILARLAKLSNSNIAHKDEIAERLSLIPNLKERLLGDNDEDILIDVAKAFTGGDEKTKVTTAKAANIFNFCSLFNARKFDFISTKALKALAYIKKNHDGDNSVTEFLGDDFFNCNFFDNLYDFCGVVSTVKELYQIVHKINEEYERRVVAQNNNTNIQNNTNREQQNNLSITEKLSILVDVIKQPDILRDIILLGVDIVSTLLQYLFSQYAFPIIMGEIITKLIIEAVYHFYKRTIENDAQDSNTNN